MYLKEIKINGFKSFADNVSLLFNKGITGIVGPNGSGKSNIVDAVRWVLGEQSVKSLRADIGMTDVIFSGSKDRKSLSSASVCLIFDNSSKLLPIEFEEVSIKRVVYKTGENEYYLNNTICRLKDINDLFIDSGANKEAFNIISQGQISEIINSKPNERRVIFESAASVLKYKKRKLESLRKLEKTNDNITRVKDIINELESIIEPLEIESIKAKKYNALNDMLVKYEKSIIVYDLETLTHEIDKDKKLLIELNNDLIKLSTDSSNSDALLEKKKLDIQEINNKLSVLNKDYINLNNRVVNLNSEKILLSERKKFNLEKQDINDNIFQLKTRELKLSSNIKALEQEITIKKEELNSIIELYNSYKSNLDKLLSDKDFILRGLNNLVLDETRIKHEIELKSEVIENNSLLPRSVRSIINNKNLNTHGTVESLINYDTKYTTPLSYALSSVSNFIVVDDEEVAKKCVNYLKNNQLGRATFFPINKIKSKYIDDNTISILKENRYLYIEIFSNLVSYSELYKNIINNVLGDVILTKDIDDANKLSKLINNRYKIVTLAGEIINKGGSITGGTNNRETNPVNTKHEIDVLKRKLEIIENDIINHEGNLKDIDDKYSNIEKLFQENNLKLINQKELINNKTEVLNSLNVELKGIISELSDNKNILDDNSDQKELQLIKEIYETEDLIKHHNNEIDANNKRRTNLEYEISDLEKSIKFNNSKMNKISSEIKTIEINISKNEVRIDSLLDTLTNQYNITYEKALNEYVLDIDLEEAREIVYKNKKLIKELGIVNLNSISEYEKVNERYNFLLTQTDDLERAKDTLIHIIEEMDEIMKKEFLESFNKINEEFGNMFMSLFNGGYASLKLTDEENILETGVEIIASPPGKKISNIGLLSGGEKTLTTIALILAILKTNPVPFIIFDEVEAALDDVNVDNFGKTLLDFKDKTQFILITHKKRTMEYADCLYGITMQNSGVSKLISVKFEK